MPRAQLSPRFEGGQKLFGVEPAQNAHQLNMGERQDPSQTRPS